MNPLAMESPAKLEGVTGDEVARFGADLVALWPEGMDAGRKLGLAVSGGPDSVAMLLLAAVALPGRVEAATVDHGLRKESAREARDVAAICERLGIPHAILPVTVEAGNVQAQARVARYAALARWLEDRELSALATAHHADDQAETFLLRLNRASGVAGLAGTRARGLVPETRVPLLRPVLGWRRAELGAVVGRTGVVVADDPSNRDDRFDRVRMRKALAETDWLDARAIAESAAHVADADAAIEWTAGLEWQSRVRKEPFGMSYKPMAPRAIALRVIARIVRELSAEEPRGSTVARLYEALAAGKPATIADLVVRPGASGWSFSRSPVRKAAPARKPVKP